MRGRGWWRRPVLWAAVVVVVWLLGGGPLGSFQGRLSEVQENDQATYLPATAEATRADELAAQFTESDVVPAVLVFERPGGLTAADETALTELAGQITALPEVVGPPSEVAVSQDRAAAQLMVGLDEDAVSAGVVALREMVAAGTPEGVSGYVAGPAGFVADLADAFGHIDGLLILVTASVVAVILIVVYRSPLLPLLVLIGAGLALGTASAAVYLLADRGLVILNGQSQGIMLILVFGAATDYALLLVARFREELRHHPDRFAAMAVAWRRSLGPILASGSTVILALLCLLASDLNSNRSLGPVASIGIAAALLVMLTYLPAVLSLFGRVAFWPFSPTADSQPRRRSGWARVADLVGRRDRAVWIVTALVLAGFAALLPQFHADGVEDSELFLNEAESTTGQQVLARHFPAGASAPTVIIANADQTGPVLAAAGAVNGIVQVAPTGERDGLVRIMAVLSDPPDSDAAIATVTRLRDAVHAVPNAEALVGGPTAVDLDTREAARHDQRVIIPLALLVVFLVIALLLRALVVPLLLLGSVVLSFAATLGLAALVFNHLFDFPGADPSLPLYAFLFLVALGVDYSIFLMTRVREETTTHGTREGVRIGLTVTGGVITSAGVVLAATFSALAVLPILFLAQIAFIVAAGVLIDTFVVRSLLVPGLCHDIGRRVWWPSRLARRPEPTG
jgi:RND superfamily putative drug exporter